MIHERGVPSRTVAVVELADGRRSVVVDPDPVAAAERVELDLVGESITIAAAGRWG